MPSDYIPGADAAFDTWLNNFITYAGDHFADLGLVAADIAPLAALSDWQTDYAAHVVAQQAAQGARQTKDATRATLEGLVRPLVRRLQASAAVSDAERAALGITIPDTTRTAAAAPATRPVVVVDAKQRLRHSIAFADEGTPTKKAKPPGVQGAEIWHAVLAQGAAAPTSADQLTFLALDSATPYVADFDGADAGKVSHYWVRWVNAKGERGPWSEAVAATIGG